MAISLRLFFITSLLLFLPFIHIKGQKTQYDDTIKIGLLISDKNAPAAMHGAELAIKKANGKGGYSGHPFKIVARSMEGPWGTGSKEATDLIFNEKVWAIIGSHDGRNAHIVEQVTTKAGMIFLSAWAGDPTLSQAFTPWYFSCVPNNLQQADILIDEIFVKRKSKNAAIVADKGYDSEQAVKSLSQRLKTNGYSIPSQLRYESSADIKNLVNQIIEKDPDCIVFFGRPSPSVNILNLLKEKRLDCPMFGTLSLLDENEFHGISLENYESVVLVSPNHWFNPEGALFIDQFRELYKYSPGAVAAYAYDAVNLIVEAIITSGMDIEKVQKALMGIKYYGITGLIQFDERGNRKAPFNLIHIKNGKAVQLSVP